MKELSIKRLKDISDNWIKGKTLYSEEDIFKVDINLIINNLFFYNKIKSKISKHYLNTYNSLKKDGWNKKHPMIIGIGTEEEIYVTDGNHRISIIKYYNKRIKLYRLLHCKFPIDNNKQIYCKLKYIKNKFGTEAQFKIRPNWTNERLPQWKLNEI